MSRRTSWHGRSALKDAVLAELAAIEREGVLRPLVIDGEEVDLPGSPRSWDPVRLRYALGLPADLLALGLWLFQGFPEDEERTRRHVRRMTRFLEALPVGVDLRSVAGELVAWRFEDPEVGLARRLHDDLRVLRLVEAVAAACRNGVDMEELRAPIEALRAEYAAELQARFREPGSLVDEALYIHERALATAARACDLGRHPERVASLYEESVYGRQMAGDPSPSAVDDAARAKLLERVAAAGGGPDR
ncbi:MAG: hypothetical protein KC619_07510 [Myxococcales bacterium]|nr:hypothetical protein [Myxococcales bacterium]